MGGGVPTVRRKPLCRSQHQQPLALIRHFTLHQALAQVLCALLWSEATAACAVDAFIIPISERGKIELGSAT